MREYECMLILLAEADEAVVSTAIERIDKVISPSGGAVGALDRWGRKRFAYEIERVLKLADEVIRHKILLAPPAPSEDKPRTRPEPSPATA